MQLPPSDETEDALEMTRKKQPKEHLVKVAKADRDWISPEVATELLKRASDGSKPIPWEEVKSELDEMDRLGIKPPGRG